MPPEPPRLCVFDLDGTLVNSLRDIAETLNECLEWLGLPAHPVAHYRYMVGEGVPKLCQRAIGDSHPHLIARLIELARPRYRSRLLRHTRPYPGVPEMINTLRARQVRLAVLSNKPHEMTRRVVAQFWPEGVFEWVQGYVEEEYRKPHPHYLLAICHGLGVEPGTTCMIGDTPTDIRTAERAETMALGVTWGFRTRDDLSAAGAEHIVTDPSDVPRALGLR